MVNNSLLTNRAKFSATPLMSELGGLVMFTHHTTNQLNSWRNPDELTHWAAVSTCNTTVAIPNRNSSIVFMFDHNKWCTDSKIVNKYVHVFNQKHTQYLSCKQFICWSGCCWHSNHNYCMFATQTTICPMMNGTKEDIAHFKSHKPSSLGYHRS